MWYQRSIIRIFILMYLMRVPVGCPILGEFYGSSRNKDCVYTVILLSFRTDRSGQTVQTQIRLEEQSDQGLHCLQ